MWEVQSIPTSSASPEQQIRPPTNARLRCLGRLPAKGFRAHCAHTCALGWGRPNGGVPTADVLCWSSSCRCPLWRRRRVGSASCRKTACTVFRHQAHLFPDTCTHRRSPGGSARRPKWPANLRHIDAIALSNREAPLPSGGEFCAAGPPAGATPLGAAHGMPIWGPRPTPPPNRLPHQRPWDRSLSNSPPPSADFEAYLTLTSGPPSGLRAHPRRPPHRSPAETAQSTPPSQLKDR